MAFQEQEVNKTGSRTFSVKENIAIMAVTLQQTLNEN